MNLSEHPVEVIEEEGSGRMGPYRPGDNETPALRIQKRIRQLTPG